MSLSSQAMGPDDYIETVLTCKGDYYDPGFPRHLERFSESLRQLIKTEKQRIIIKKVEPWNSVRVTFNIPKEAAQRLRLLAEQGNQALQEIGVLAVQIEGDRVISLTIAGKNNERTELVLRTSDGPQALQGIIMDGPSSSTSKSIGALFGPSGGIMDTLGLNVPGVSPGNIFRPPGSVAASPLPGQMQQSQVMPDRNGPSMPGPPCNQVRPGSVQGSNPDATIHGYSQSPNDSSPQFTSPVVSQSPPARPFQSQTSPPPYPGLAMNNLNKSVFNKALNQAAPGLLVNLLQHEGVGNQNVDQPQKMPPPDGATPQKRRRRRQRAEKSSGSADKQTKAPPRQSKILPADKEAFIMHLDDIMQDVVGDEDGDRESPKPTSESPFISSVSHSYSNSPVDSPASSINTRASTDSNMMENISAPPGKDESGVASPLAGHVKLENHVKQENDPPIQYGVCAESEEKVDDNLPAKIKRDSDHDEQYNPAPANCIINPYTGQLEPRISEAVSDSDVCDSERRRHDSGPARSPRKSLSPIRSTAADSAAVSTGNVQSSPVAETSASSADSRLTEAHGDGRTLFPHPANARNDSPASGLTQISVPSPSSQHVQSASSQLSLPRSPGHNTGPVRFPEQSRPQLCRQSNPDFSTSTVWRPTGAHQVDIRHAMMVTHSRHGVPTTGPNQGHYTGVSHTNIGVSSPIQRPPMVRMPPRIPAPQDIPMSESYTPHSIGVSYSQDGFFSSNNPGLISRARVPSSEGQLVHHVRSPGPHLHPERPAIPHSSQHNPFVDLPRSVSSGVTMVDSFGRPTRMTRPQMIPRMPHGMLDSSRMPPMGPGARIPHGMGPQGLLPNRVQMATRFARPPGSPRHSFPNVSPVQETAPSLESESNDQTVPYPISSSSSMSPALAASLPAAEVTKTSSDSQSPGTAPVSTSSRSPQPMASRSPRNTNLDSAPTDPEPVDISPKPPELLANHDTVDSLSSREKNALLDKVPSINLPNRVEHTVTVNYAMDASNGDVDPRKMSKTSHVPHFDNIKSDESVPKSDVDSRTLNSNVTVTNVDSTVEMPVIAKELTQVEVSPSASLTTTVSHSAPGPIVSSQVSVSEPVDAAPVNGPVRSTSRQSSPSSPLPDVRRQSPDPGQTVQPHHETQSTDKVETKSKSVKRGAKLSDICAKLAVQNDVKLGKSAPVPKPEQRAKSPAQQKGSSPKEERAYSPRTSKAPPDLAFLNSPLHRLTAPIFPFNLTQSVKKVVGPIPCSEPVKLKPSSPRSGSPRGIKDSSPPALQQSGQPVRLPLPKPRPTTDLPKSEPVVASVATSVPTPVSTPVSNDVSETQPAVSSSSRAPDERRNATFDRTAKPSSNVHVNPQASIKSCSLGNSVVSVVVQNAERKDDLSCPVGLLDHAYVQRTVLNEPLDLAKSHQGTVPRRVAYDNGDVNSEHIDTPLNLISSKTDVKQVNGPKEPNGQGDTAHSDVRRKSPAKDYISETDNAADKRNLRGKRKPDDESELVGSKRKRRMTDESVSSGKTNSIDYLSEDEARDELLTGRKVHDRRNTRLLSRSNSRGSDVTEEHDEGKVHTRSSSRVESRRGSDDSLDGVKKMEQDAKSKAREKSPPKLDTDSVRGSRLHRNSPSREIPDKRATRSSKPKDGGPPAQVESFSQPPILAANPSKRRRFSRDQQR